MREQIRVNIINTLIGLIIGIPLFVITAAYTPYLVVLPLLLTFFLMKCIERKIKEQTKPLLILPLLWIVSSIYLLYMLNQDGFMHGERITTAVMIILILFLSLLPISIYMLKNEDYKAKSLNILTACMVWSITAVLVYKLDIAQNDFLRGMSIMIMIFPYSIILFNLIYERTILYFESKKK